MEIINVVLATLDVEFHRYQRVCTYRVGQGVLVTYLPIVILHRYEPVLPKAILDSLVVTGYPIHVGLDVRREALIIRREVVRQTFKIDHHDPVSGEVVIVKIDLVRLNPELGKRSQSLAKQTAEFWHLQESSLGGGERCIADVRQKQGMYATIPLMAADFPIVSGDDHALQRLQFRIGSLLGVEVFVPAFFVLLEDELVREIPLGKVRLEPRLYEGQEEVGDCAKEGLHHGRLQPETPHIVVHAIDGGGGRVDDAGPGSGIEVAV
jgi:hypothetical protein